MKGLIQIVKRKNNTKTSNPKTPKNAYHMDAKSRAYVYFKIGNYWWRLSQSQWADHFQINRTTFAYRVRQNFSRDKCLGLTPIARGNPNHVKTV